MEIQWKHVFLAIAIIILLVNLPTILNTVASIFSDTTAVISKSFNDILGPDHVRNSQTFVLAKFCALLLFVVAILKLIKSWNKK